MMFFFLLGYFREIISYELINLYKMYLYLYINVMHIIIETKVNKMHTRIIFHDQISSDNTIHIGGENDILASL